MVDLKGKNLFTGKTEKADGSNAQKYLIWSVFVGFIVTLGFGLGSTGKDFVMSMINSMTSGDSSDSDSGSGGTGDPSDIIS